MKLIVKILLIIFFVCLTSCSSVKNTLTIKSVTEINLKIGNSNLFFRFNVDTLYQINDTTKVIKKHEVQR